MVANRSIPRSTVIPEIAYPDIGEAITWLTGAFGFTLRLQIANHRAQMNVGDGAVVLTERPAHVGNDTLQSSVLVRVEDAYGHCERARAYGANILREPADHPYGERQCTVVDFAGHHWTFSQSIADVDPIAWGGTIGEL